MARAPLADWRHVSAGASPGPRVLSSRPVAPRIPGHHPGPARAKTKEGAAEILPSPGLLRRPNYP